MSKGSIRLPEDWRRADRTGLIGTMLLATLLGGLWFAGLGPEARQLCDAQASSLAFRSQGDKITLSGRVGTEAERAQLVASAQKAYGVGNVVDAMKVERGTLANSWARNADPLFGHLKRAGGKASLSLKDGRAVLEGEVGTPGEKTAAATDIKRLLGDKIAVADGIMVRPPPPPPQVKAPPPPPQITDGRFRLPDGTVIDFEKDGLEAKLLRFITDDSKAVDRGLWFDFDRLQFRTGSADLTPESKRQIDTLVSILKAYPNVAVKIGGYTDNVGDPANNLSLSGTRAERVATELKSLGIAADRVEHEGYGEQHPIADNATAEGRAQNRRTALSVRRK